MQMDTSGWAWVDEHAERLGIRDMDKLIMKSKFRTLGQLLKMEAPELCAMLNKCEGMTYEDKGDFVKALAQWKSLLKWCRNVEGGTWKPRRPQTSEDLMALTVIRLRNCGITGEIPPGISYLTQLNVLDLGDNNLTGNIPNSLGNCVNLVYLRLYDNKLTGEIPKGLGNCINLKVLVLWNNKLTGSIPNTLGNCTKLEWLSLRDNKLEGNIPKSLGNCTKLKKLTLGSNELIGNIPALGLCIHLQELDLSSNFLVGAEESKAKLKKQLPNCSICV